MKVKCRSLLIRSSQRINNVTVRNEYYMDTLQEHEVDLPIFRTARFYLYFPFALLMAIAGVGGLIVFPLICGGVFYFREDPKELFKQWYFLPAIAACVLLTVFFAWKLSVGEVRKEMLEEAVRSERKLAKTTPLEIVPDWEWKLFSEKLKESAKK
ncbi:hypothetical protein ETAA8_30810 [Anatilimnocola aggregata]|uniref:Uncharacterized protein n=1 Tax=Anatilimnocola aggregata TaxID=2528021 RepID=A0A517YCR9_9BACT|nr:hypothetical protein [Anatilimnocola aggregata]QDU27989.1 hypothetical protein ETAA8_30810 [Anatilimnocola aggregata]